MNELLSSIYYNTKNSAAFCGVDRLFNEAKQLKPDLTKEDVKKWLSGELTNSLHKPLTKRFKRNRILVKGIDSQWEADLVDMKEFSKENDNYCYILTVIDCFSKYAFAQPIKKKTGLSIINAFKIIFKKRKPIFLRTDKGKEFCNAPFQRYLNQQHVKYFTSNDEKIKCAIVERFNRSLKGRMFKYFTAKGNRKYLNILQDLVKGYNNSVHRTIKFKPIEVTKANESIVFKNIYKCNNFLEATKQQTKQNLDINKGDKVRKAYNLKAFDRGFYPNWTDEIFTVEKAIKGDKQVVFRLKDYSGNLSEQ